VRDLEWHPSCSVADVLAWNPLTLSFVLTGLAVAQVIGAALLMRLGK
jgi:hypothetical protein